MAPSFPPSISFDIFDGAASVVGFGAQKDNFNFSLKDLQSMGDEKKQENEGLVRCFREVANHFNIRRIYAPRPVNMNSEVVDPQDLGVELVIDYKDFGDAGGLETLLLRGVNADGIRLPEKSMFAVSSADCALIVVKWRNQMWAAHAGRDSLMDRELIETNGLRVGKYYPSVVNSIMEEIPRKFSSETQVFMGCTISKGAHFEHPIDHPNPKYAEFNQKMINHIWKTYGQPVSSQDMSFWERGQIDMKWLMRRQFESYGVIHFETDNICTYSEINPNDTFKWYSNRRDKIMRNLFLVIRQ